MANLQYNLSPQVFAYIIEGLAKGDIQPYNIHSQVHADTPLHYKNFSAVFTKEGPGNYTVTMVKDGTNIGVERAGTPVEAKMMVLGYLQSCVKLNQLEHA